MMNILWAVIIYLALGLVFIVPFGRRRALKATKPNMWAIVWFTWPVAMLMMIYLFINAFVVLLIEWDNE